MQKLRLNMQLGHRLPLQVSPSTQPQKCPSTFYTSKKLCNKDMYWSQPPAELLLGQDCRTAWQNTSHVNLMHPTVNEYVIHIWKGLLLPVQLCNPLICPVEVPSRCMFHSSALNLAKTMKKQAVKNLKNTCMQKSLFIIATNFILPIFVMQGSKFLRTQTNDYWMWGQNTPATGDCGTLDCIQQRSE